MPRNAKEGILFSFIMSAFMIYIMAALNYGVRTGDFGGTAWYYSLMNFPLAYAVGMVCDLCMCTPLSRKIAEAITVPSDRPVWRGFVVKFSMVVLMTICMTIYGVFAAVGVGAQDVAAFLGMFPYNFILALPIQMCVIAPLSGKIVHRVGDAFGWNEPGKARGAEKEAPSVSEATLVASNENAKNEPALESLVLRDVYTISQSSTIMDAMNELVDKKVSGMPVVSDTGKVVAFISDSDILRFLSNKDMVVVDIANLVQEMNTNKTVSERLRTIAEKNVMEAATKKVITVDEDVTLEELCSLFGFTKLKKVPVVGEDSKLAGIINRSDVTRYSMSQFSSAVA